MVRRILASSRYLIAVAALGSFLSAATLLVYGALAVVNVIWDTIGQGEVTVDGSKGLAVQFIQLTDVFLLGTVLYIVALGLYDLFVDPGLPVPPWLHIRSLDDLKSKLVQVIVVLLGVTFLGAAVEWDGGGEILELGAAVALVIAALGLATLLSRLPSRDKAPDDGERRERTG